MPHPLIPRPIHALAAALFFLSGALQAATPKVMVSIQPIHSLVTGVMDGIAEPVLLIRGNLSPHDFTLRPSDARNLNRADLVIWVGATLESPLASMIPTLSGQVIELLEIEGLEHNHSRHGGIWEGHDHEEDHEEDHEGDHEEDHEAGNEERDDETDPHIWLSPHNAATIVTRVAHQLMTMDPDNSSRYQHNAANLIARIEKMDREIDVLLQPLQQVPYIVFHDAYQAFEAHYHLNTVGSVTVNPEQIPGARRIHQLRERITLSHAHCVFSEPQFESKLVATIIEDTGAKKGTLDPMGSSLKSGKDAYFIMMRKLATSLSDCLGQE